MAVLVLLLGFVMLLIVKETKGSELRSKLIALCVLMPIACEL